MKKILIVDDEMLSTMTLAMFLEDEGYTVQTAGSGREALERSTSFTPDILVSDWRLGDDIDGLDLARQLKKQNRSLRTILCSGLSMDEVKLEDPETGVFKVLEKPYSLDEILGVIKTAPGA